MDIKIYNDNLKFKFGVSAIVINNNKLFVDKYGDDSYCLPGGYVEFGEDSKKAILREMKEETNQEYEIVEFVGIIENFFTNLKGQKTHEIDFYYLLKLKNNKTIENLVINSLEKGGYGDICHQFKWIDIDDLKQINLLPSDIKDIIKSKKRNFHLIIKD